MANAKIKASAKVSATVIPMATVKVSANVKGKGNGNAARSEWMQYLSTKLGNGGTVAETIALISDQYDAMQLTQHSVLDYHRQIGASLLEIRSVVGKSDKMFGQFVANTDLNVISRHDRTDMMWVAANWAAIQKANNGGKLDSLSPSRIRRLLKETKPSHATDKPAKAAKSTDGDAVTTNEVEADGEDFKEVTFDVSNYAAKVLTDLEQNGATLKDFLVALKSLTEM
jgi:hypothetical protein